MTARTFPCIEANYTPVPNRYIEDLLSTDYSREEIVAELYVLYKSYGWKGAQTTISVANIMKDTVLTKEEAREGLRKATERGILLALPLVDNDPDSLQASYLLNTEENARFVNAYCMSSPAEPIAPPEEEYSQPLFDDDSSDDLLPYEDEMPSERQDPEPTPLPLPSVQDSEMPFNAKTIGMLIKLLGRPVTKAERDRLVDLPASDTEFITAMSSLLSKTTKVYSSDLVIYEYERIKAQENKVEKYERAKEGRQESLQRQKECKRCEGLGYVFLGANNIQECECKKPKD